MPPLFNQPCRLGFLASHRGSNLQAILDACRSGQLPAIATVVISNNANAGALARAKAANVPAVHLSGRTHPGPVALDEAIAETLSRHAVDLVVLAGYMKKLGLITLARYRGRIVNIHPSLLPKHGGLGMYGERVHAAVLAAGETESGASVHVVSGEYDQGPVLAQKRVAVLPGDTVESLAARVLEQEHALYVETLKRIIAGELPLPV